MNAPRAAAIEAFLGTPLVWGRREGARFENAADGRWYWNCHVNGGVYNLGHRHPAVLAAVRRALETVDLGNHYLEAPLRTELAGRLSATTGGRLSGVVLSPSGGEATDVALKFARAHTGREGVVSAQGGYHGHTGLAMATGEPRWRERFHHELPGFAQVPFADLGALDAAVGDGTAAVILETIPATLGMPQPRRDTCAPRATCAGSAARCSSWTRCRPGSGAAARCGRMSRTEPSRTSSRPGRA